MSETRPTIGGVGVLHAGPVSADSLGSGLVVLLASFPRSGNTLCRQVIEQCFRIPTYTIYSSDTIWTDRQWPEDAQTGAPCYFVKTHGFAKPAGSVIYIVRDPRDAMISYWHYTERSNGTPQQHTLEQYLCDGLWSAHVQWYRQQSAVFIKYEDMLADPVGIVSTAIRQAGVILNDEALGSLTSFAALHESNPTFWRAGTAGQWRTVFTPAQHELIWRTNGETMEHLGYERD